MKHKITSIVLAIILTLSFYVSGCNPTDNNQTFTDDSLTVFFFDVGQADCNLLIFPDSTTMLIDAGNVNDGRHISNYISSLGIDEIDYFVCTHPHEDHIGGSKEIFNNLRVNSILIPSIPEDVTKDNNLHNNLIEYANNEGCKTIKLNSNTVICENDTYNITALSPDSNAVYSDLNNYSLSLIINCYTNTLIFMGDAETPAELDILDNGIYLDADILKVGHHGGKTSTSEKFLNEVTPQVAIISCGINNKYGHPHNDTVKRLNQIGTKTYRTDTVGTIIAKCYDGGFNIETDNSISLNGG